MLTNKKWIAIVLLVPALMLSACSNWSRTAKGGAIGGAAGGTIGGVIGKKSGNTVAGILIGAAIGGAAGAAIGRYMDKQAEEMEEEMKDAEIERVGEGIKITFDSGILFDVNSAALRPEARENIRQMATTMKKYEDTEIVIQGHTDSSGSEEYNQQLSERRAKSVADYAIAQGIRSVRIVTQGFGETMPVADNSTASGKQKNRRVEIAVYANDELKQEARSGKLD